MPYDPNRKIFLPDFQANGQLPQWQQGMGGDDSESQNLGAIGSAFKQRFMGGDSSAVAPHESMPHGAGGAPTPMEHSAMPAMEIGHGALPAPSGASSKLAGGGGAFKSLG